MKMRKDKDIKRRLQLSKHTGKTYEAHQADENRRSARVMFAKSGKNKDIVYSDNTSVKTPISKRMIAIIMAIAIVLALVPASLFLTLRGRADDEEGTLGTVTLQAKANGTLLPNTVTIQPGIIEETIKSATVDGLPEGAEYVKTVLVDHENDDAETEIKSIASYNGTMYYSLNDETDFGTQVKGNGKQEVFLIFSTKYWITTEGTGNGSYEWNAHKEGDKYFIWSEENLEFKKIEPNEHYTIDSISYVSTTSNSSVKVKDSAATIPASEIKGDIQVSFNFKEITSYSITDVSYANGLGNGGIAQTRGVSSLTSSQYSSYFRTRWVPSDITNSQDGTFNKTFYLYSNSSSGGSNYQLNMLRINGEELEVSAIDTENGITATLKDGTVVNVKLVATQAGMYWLDNKPSSLIHDRDYSWSRNSSTGKYDASSTSRKKRTIYEITVSDVHSNLNIEYNFKQKNNREIIIKGLNGITETAHAQEKTSVGKYNYFFESADSNVYTAYYNQTLGVPSANLYLYRVKEGYNPYTVTSKLYYVDDDNNIEIQNGILSGEVVGRPEEAIKNATAGVSDNGQSQYNKFDISYRYWGGYNQQVVSITNDNDKYVGTEEAGNIFNGKPYVLTTLGEEYGENPSAPIWYGIALTQNAAKNQQLYLNATPYMYTIELDLDGGNFNDSDEYKQVANSGIVKQQKTISNEAVITYHSIENPITYLPTEEPTKENKIFEGWQIQKLNDAGTEYVPVDEYALDADDLYQKADQITITGDTLGLINGNEKVDNQIIRFKAIWKDVKDSSKTTVSTEIYVETVDGSGDYDVGGKNYTRTHYSTETQMVGTTTILLNQYPPENKEYYEMRSGRYEDNGTEVKYTKLSTTSVEQSSDEIPENNKLRIYYDLKKETLTVKKVVKGKPKTSEYKITLTLMPESDSNSPISYNQAKSMITLADGGKFTESDNTLTYQKTFQRGDTLTVSDIPYGWTYSVNEAASTIADDYTTTYSPAQNGKLTSDTNVTVTNTGKNPGIDTTKTLTKTNDTFTLDLNAWATGDSISLVDEDTTALDIALVVDQSGSMNDSDVGEAYVPYKVDNKNKTKWTLTEALSGTYYAYDTTDKKYYQVTGNGSAGTIYSSAGTSFNIKKNFQRENTTVLGDVYWYGDASDLYYLDTNHNIHKVYWNTWTEAVNIGTWSAFYVTLYYFNNSVTGSVPNVTEGKSLDSPDSDFNTAMTNKTVTLLGTGTQWQYAWGYFSNNWAPSGTSSTYSGTLYSASKGSNQLQYTRDNGEVVTISSTAILASDTVYNGYLYEKRAVTRAEALQLSLGEFMETVKDNAEVQGVDHRVSLIGFAGNDVPGYSTKNGVYNYSGQNRSYDYVNTGLFVDGTFKSYNEITNFTMLDDDATAYVNAHYFINYNSQMRPVTYSGGNWYVVPDSTHSPASNSVAVSRALSTESQTSSKYWFYEPVYAPLTDNNGTNFYKRALQSVNDDGEVNEKILNEIDMIGAYGGTYTSFGMDMASEVFHYNPITEGENRKRIVIVFSDGAPGYSQSVFDEGVAAEAKADADRLKSEYNAEVFTVYLYGGDEGRNSNAASFMEQLSSNYSHSLTPVYEPELDYSDGYVYKTGTKTTSVTASAKAYVKNANSWSIYEGDVLSEVEPSDQTYTEGSLWNKQTYRDYTFYYDAFYDADTKQYVEVKDLEIGKQYLYGYWYKVDKYLVSGNNETYSSTKSTDKSYHAYTSGGNPITVIYNYLWYDSSGLIVVPMTDENDTEEKHYQFYKVVETHLETDEQYYYQETKSASDLIGTFKKITESLDLPGTIVTLDASNSVMRDVVTKDFELPKTQSGDVDLTKFTVRSVAAESINSNGVITWSTTDIQPIEISNSNLVITENKDGTKTIDVKNFPYGENYTSEGHLGRKLQVIIEGMTPAEGSVGTIESNTSASGIYWVDSDIEKMVAEFPIPSTTIDVLNAKVKLNYGGTGKINGLKFPVTFKLTKSDGKTAYSGKYGDYTFSSDGLFETTMGDGEYKFFEGIPENAKLTVTVTAPDEATKYYVYSIKGLDSPDADKEFGEQELTVDITSQTAKGGKQGDEQLSDDLIDITREVEINITDDRRIVTITNSTRGEIADLHKEFPLSFVLKDENGKKVSGTFLDIYGQTVDFENGKPTSVIGLADGERTGFYVPNGYSLEIADAEDPDPYVTSFDDYTENVTISDGTATAVMNSVNGALTIIHSVENIVPTGVSEDERFLPNWVWAIVGALTLAAGAFAVYDRRKRKFTN